MNTDFDYVSVRPYVWVAVGICVLGILGPELFGFSDKTGAAIFVVGFIVFCFGIFKGMKSTK